MSDENNRKYNYGILGAGRQGTAAAYDMIVHGEAAGSAPGRLRL